jgi:hypothetical protein
MTKYIKSGIIYDTNEGIILDGKKVFNPDPELLLNAGYSEYFGGEEGESRTRIVNLLSSHSSEAGQYYYSDFLEFVDTNLTVQEMKEEFKRGVDLVFNIIHEETHEILDSYRASSLVNDLLYCSCILEKMNYETPGSRKTLILRNDNNQGIYICAREDWTSFFSPDLMSGDVILPKQILLLLSPSLTDSNLTPLQGTDFVYIELRDDVTRINDLIDLVNKISSNKQIQINLIKSIDTNTGDIDSVLLSLSSGLINLQDGENQYVLSGYSSIDSKTYTLSLPAPTNNVYNFTPFISASGIDGLPTVTSSDNGKVLQVVDGAWELVTPLTLYSGAGLPNNAQGNNGDIYIQT